MSQLAATFMKTMRFFVRSRALLLGIALWPMALLILMNFTELGAIPASEMSLAQGDLTIAMVSFAVMLACVMNLPGSIARDREIGLLVKLRSMPISPVVDTAGRLLAYLLFAVLVAGGITLVGLGLGARFTVGPAEAVESAGYLLMMVVAASGIGLVLGSLIRSVQGTAFFGLAVSLIFAFVSGIFVPYDQLPTLLQSFSRAFPISSATASVSYLTLGQEVTGYDPLTFVQTATGVAFAAALLAIGLVLYYETSWRPTSGSPRQRLRPRRRLVRRVYALPPPRRPSHVPRPCGGTHGRHALAPPERREEAVSGGRRARGRAPSRCIPLPSPRRTKPAPRWPLRLRGRPPSREGPLAQREPS